MKSLKFFGLCIGVAGSLLLTSCLSKDNRIQGMGYGKYYLGSKNNPMQYVLRTYSPNIGGVYDFVFPSIEDKEIDGFCRFTYDLNFDEGQNFNNTGYYNVGITAYEKVNQQTEIPNYPITNDVINSVTDNQQSFVEMAAVGLVNDYLFLASSRNNGVEKQTTYYQMYYNPDSVTTESGKRVYNIYVKGYRDKSGSLSTTNAATECNVFDIGYIWQMLSDRENSEDAVNIRFKFMKSVDVEKRTAEWTQSSTILQLYNKNKVG